jgi:hypothetical protein
MFKKWMKLKNKILEFSKKYLALLKRESVTGNTACSCHDILTISNTHLSIGGIQPTVKT